MCVSVSTCREIRPRRRLSVDHVFVVRPLVGVLGEHGEHGGPLHLGARGRGGGGALALHQFGLAAVGGGERRRGGGGRGLVGMRETGWV